MSAVGGAFRDLQPPRLPGRGCCCKVHTPYLWICMWVCTSSLQPRDRAVFRAIPARLQPRPEFCPLRLGQHPVTPPAACSVQRAACSVQRCLDLREASFPLLSFFSFFFLFFFSSFFFSIWNPMRWMGRSVAGYSSLYIYSKSPCRRRSIYSAYLSARRGWIERCSSVCPCRGCARTTPLRHAFTDAS